jgi:hypothetical protein
LSEIEENTCEREGELEIKLERKKVQGIEREMENLFILIKKLKKIGKEEEQ